MAIAVNRWPDKYDWERVLNGIDWAARLDNETIATVTAEVVAGDVVISDPAETTFEGTVQSVWISGGTPGSHQVMCRAMTASGLKLQEIQRFKVVASPA